MESETEINYLRSNVRSLKATRVFIASYHQTRYKFVSFLELTEPLLDDVHTVEVFFEDSIIDLIRKIADNDNIKTFYSLKASLYKVICLQELHLPFQLV